MYDQGENISQNGLTFFFSFLMDRKQLRDFFNTSVLQETVVQILHTFMSMRSPHFWADYLMPEEARSRALATASSSDVQVFSDGTKFDQLMAETRAVITRYAINL